MTGARVVSPMLFGIKDASGFGNNADELGHSSATTKRIIAPQTVVHYRRFWRCIRTLKSNLDLYFTVNGAKSDNTNLSPNVCSRTEKKNLWRDNVADELINLGTDVPEEGITWVWL
jgi:hypothetical protein